MVDDTGAPEPSPAVKVMVPKAAGLPSNLMVPVTSLPVPVLEPHPATPRASAARGTAATQASALLRRGMYMTDLSMEHHAGNRTRGRAGTSGGRLPLTRSPLPGAANSPRGYTRGPGAGVPGPHGQIYQLPGPPATG